MVPSDYGNIADPVSRDILPSYDQIKGMVREAIELQGGIEGVIEEGDEVMLKVNLVGGNCPSGQADNTDVKVVKALIKVIYDFPNDISFVVAEGTIGTTTTLPKAEVYGITRDISPC